MRTVASSVSRYTQPTFFLHSSWYAVQRQSPGAILWTSTA